MEFPLDICLRSARHKDVNAMSHTFVFLLDFLSVKLSHKSIFPIIFNLSVQLLFLQYGTYMYVPMGLRGNFLPKLIF